MDKLSGYIKHCRDYKGGKRCKEWSKVKCAPGMVKETPAGNMRCLKYTLPLDEQGEGILRTLQEYLKPIPTRKLTQKQLEWMLHSDIIPGGKVLDVGKWYSNGGVVWAKTFALDVQTFIIENNKILTDDFRIPATAKRITNFMKTTRGPI
ncbi:MAG: hypothetical protein ACYS1A_20310, partial [Planctomycetota bacterium]